MKWLVIFGVACNQLLYDQMYRQIVLTAIQSIQPLEVKLRERNKAIDYLRSLCNGQISSYERGERTPTANRVD